MPPASPATEEGWIPLAKPQTRRADSELRSTILVGLVAGAVGGLLMGVLILFYVNPIIRAAEDFEPPSDEPDVVTQNQRDAGTVLGSLVFGVVGGVLLGGAAAGLRPLYQIRSHVRWGLFLGALAFLATVVVPAIYHPPLPPAVESVPEGSASVEAGTPIRLAGYIAVLAASVAGVVLSSVVWHRFSSLAPRQPGFGFACAAATFLGVAALPFLWLPTNLIASEVPESLIREFQVASFSVRLVFWLLTGWLLGILGARWSWAARPRRAAA